MYRLRVSKSYGGEAPYRWMGQYVFSTKEQAIVVALKSLPGKDTEIRWITGEKGDIRFRFIHAERACSYEMWIDILPVNTVPKDIFADMSIMESED